MKGIKFILPVLALSPFLVAAEDCLPSSPQALRYTIIDDDRDFTCTPALASEEDADIAVYERSCLPAEEENTDFDVLVFSSDLTLGLEGPARLTVTGASNVLIADADTDCVELETQDDGDVVVNFSCDVSSLKLRITPDASIGEVSVFATWSDGSTFSVVEISTNCDTLQCGGLTAHFPLDAPR